MHTNEKITCPLCRDAVDKLIYRYHIDSEKRVIEKIKEDHPAWAANDGVCARCLDYYQVIIIQEQRMLPSVGPYFPIKTEDDFVVLPTGLRVDAHPRFAGRGVTICFLDSGFCMHPDLTAYKNRIKEIVDITGDDNGAFTGGAADNSAWHGTMTTVVGAGDGFLSKGLYKGIASEADLVLIKVQGANGKISTQNTIKGLEWVLQNYQRHGIRIVNMSFSDDATGSYKDSPVSQLAELLVEKGIAVVAAAGNSEYGAIHPPANSPNVITVGGIDDENRLDAGGVKAYHSTYGMTVDAFTKPELVAHAIWIAAPILPGTKEQAEAQALYRLLNTEGQQLFSAFNKHKTGINIDPGLLKANDIAAPRSAIIKRVRDAKYLSGNYMHVDGTSFAAPIVTGVIAQLLEANPALTPAMIREILFSTATRIESIVPERQGFGVIQPRKALLRVIRREVIEKPHPSPFVNKEKNSIEFYIQNDHAEHVSLCGSFNNWAKDVLLMEPGKNGLWKIEVPLLPPGRYEYKFLIDGRAWAEDVDNPYKKPDGFSGFNSILAIQN